MRIAFLAAILWWATVIAVGFVFGWAALGTGVTGFYVGAAVALAAARGSQ